MVKRFRIKCLKCQTIIDGHPLYRDFISCECKSVSVDYDPSGLNHHRLICQNVKDIVVFNTKDQKWEKFNPSIF